MMNTDTFLFLLMNNHILRWWMNWDSLHDQHGMYWWWSWWNTDSLTDITTNWIFILTDLSYSKYLTTQFSIWISIMMINWTINFVTSQKMRTFITALNEYLCQVVRNISTIVRCMILIITDSLKTERLHLSCDSYQTTANKLLYKKSQVKNLLSHKLTVQIVSCGD